MLESLNKKKRMRLGTSPTITTVGEVLSQEALTLLVPETGLADRLSALGGFMALCDILQKKIKIYWPVNEYCNGKLTDVFDVNFEYLEFEGKGFLGKEAMQEVLSQEPSTFFQFRPGWGAREIYRLFVGILIPEQISEEEFKVIALTHLKSLSLKENLRNKIDVFRHAKLQPNPIGIHMRRTDMICRKKLRLPAAWQLLERQVTKTDALAFALIEKHAAKGTHFFLACDDRKYQREIRRFVLAHGCTISTHVREFSAGLRQTSLQDAICDLYLLSHCKKILRCGPSGFSSLAAQIGNIPTLSVKVTPDWYAKIQKRIGLFRRIAWYRRPWIACMAIEKWLEC